ncbi:MAG: hypothetical protein LBI87_06060 [Candidatus Accumulibacter sp.]|jgi:hypothetical protein|nr:hypothetical protein [Accumulibacter sp.]
MQALILPASRGPRWLVEGFAIFRKKPALLSFLVLGYWLSMVVVWSVPWLGQWIGFLLLPAFSVSLMNACRLIDRKETLPPQVLFSGFHRNLPSLLALGAIYILVMLLILGVSQLFDIGISFPVQPVGEVQPGETPEHVTISLLAVALLFPVNLVFGLAPVLTAWHDMPAGKSLFFSAVACLRNWRPFLLYLLALLFVMLAGGCALRLIGDLLGQGAGLLPVTTALAAGILIFMPIVWHASFYIGYRDIFAGMRDAS